MVQSGKVSLCIFPSFLSPPPPSLSVQRVCVCIYEREREMRWNLWNTEKNNPNEQSARDCPEQRGQLYMRAKRYIEFCMVCKKRMERTFSPSPVTLESELTQWNWLTVESGQAKGRNSLLSTSSILINSLLQDVVMATEVDVFKRDQTKSWQRRKSSIQIGWMELLLLETECQWTTCCRVTPWEVHPFHILLPGSVWLVTVWSRTLDKLLGFQADLEGL